MAASDGTSDAHPDVAIAALTSSPDRTVFTEESNPDGWISTDLTVDVTP